MTFAAIWAFLRSPLGRRLALGAAIVAGFFVLRAHFVEVGRLKGEAAATQAANTQLVQNWQQDRQQTAEENRRRDQAIDALQARVEASIARADELAAQALAIAQQRQVAAAKVDQVPDSALHAYNVAQLALRPPGDRTVCYTSPEERSIGKCLADRPLLTEQLDKTGKQLTEAQSQASDRAQQLGLARTNYAQLTGYATRLERDYVTLYNLSSKKSRRWWCAWLCRRGPTLSVPPPQDLMQTSATEVKQ